MKGDAKTALKQTWGVLIGNLIVALFILGCLVALAVKQ